MIVPLRLHLPHVSRMLQITFLLGAPGRSAQQGPKSMGLPSESVVIDHLRCLPREEDRGAVLTNCSRHWTPSCATVTPRINVLLMRMTGAGMMIEPLMCSRAVVLRSILKVLRSKRTTRSRCTPLKGASKGSLPHAQRREYRGFNRFGGEGVVRLEDFGQELYRILTRALDDFGQNTQSYRHSLPTLAGALITLMALAGGTQSAR